MLCTIPWTGGKAAKQLNDGWRSSVLAAGDQ
jgi:hypothetical protein